MKSYYAKVSEIVEGRGMNIFIIASLYVFVSFVGSALLYRFTPPDTFHWYKIKLWIFVWPLYVVWSIIFRVWSFIAGY